MPDNTLVADRLIIDWFAFSVRLDLKSDRPFIGTLNMQYLCDLLGIPVCCFEQIGKLKFYKEMWKYNNISIAIPYEGAEATEGYLVTLTGDGCRYYERHHYHDLYDTPVTIWTGLFERVRKLNDLGLSVNITRLDIALDDMQGVLDINEISRCALAGEVASRFRTRPSRTSFRCPYLSDGSIIETNDHGQISKTVEFGRRQSRSFCRIYDKLAEQRAKAKDDEARLAELAKIDHWVRVEFVFKAENAIALVQAYCDEPDFARFYASYINGMLRFIHRDDAKVTRCTVKEWWAKFLGTIERITLSLGDWKPINRARHMSYVYRQLSGAIYTAAVITEDVDELFENIVKHATKKLNGKYKMLCLGSERGVEGLSSAQLWRLLNPIKRKETA